MYTYTELFTELLKTLELEELLSEQDLEMVRAAEAHHRAELLRAAESELAGGYDPCWSTEAGDLGLYQN